MLAMWSSEYVQPSGLLSSSTYQQSGSVCPLRWHAGHFVFRDFFFVGLSFSIEVVPALFRFGPVAASEGVFSSSGSPANSVLKALPLAIVFEVFFGVSPRVSRISGMS